MHTVILGFTQNGVSIWNKFYEKITILRKSRLVPHFKIRNLSEMLHKLRHLLLHLEIHEFAYVTGPTKPASISSQNHEPARNYVARLSRSPSSGSSASSARQNQERATNYVAGLSRSPSSGSSASSARQNQERATNYSARPSEPPVSLSKNYEPARNIAGASKNHEPSRIYFPGQRTSINGPVPYYQNNYLGTSFPEIQEQMIRLENPNAPLRPQNHLIAPRKEKIIHSESYIHRPANPSNTNNEDVIKTIIQFVKSSMNQNFSIEILLTLSKWHIELKSYHIQPTVSKKLKTAITRTLNDIVLYISDNLFGVPCNLLLKSYVEQIIQVVASHHKELLTSLLPWFRINHNNDQWMSNIIKLLSQSQPSLPSDPRNQVNSEHNRGPVIHNHPNRMYSVPVSNHTYPHHNIAPQNYYFQNYHAPPQPYQGYHYQPNPLRENYMSNMEHRRNEMLLPYPVNHLDPAIERQRDQQNMQVLYRECLTELSYARKLQHTCYADYAQYVSRR
ncbi:hypothetical protein NQ314_010283 [Rhamnusium bicolor]|uniref:Uncharacterized protein n=1 Tax=Rhamnusium bicolor TaxID=1586634 RepID=A0AAV8XRZ6_9CUCU|nr:hypothetical protein NQ314_010283 [Rhamnusium bicolor]